jgi:hypothetical protein
MLPGSPHDVWQALMVRQLNIWTACVLAQLLRLKETVPSPQE